MDQIDFEINDRNEMILTESKTMRDELVFKDSVLDKVKQVSMLPGTFELTIDMIANYYEVGYEAVMSIIKRHRDEFNEYAELRVLKGKSLKEFRDVHLELRQIIDSNTRNLTVVNRRGLLRVGMLLTKSEVAKAIRHYLLNVEEITEKEQKQWAVEREIARRERKQLTDAIRDFYIGSMKKGIAYSVLTDMVYKLLFDTNTKGLREMYGIDKNEPLRDYLSTEDLKRVVKAEKTVSALLLLGKGKREIESELLKNKGKF
ncbi:hypothetical protein ACWA2B_10405 [Paenibacillus sp. CMM36]